MCTDGVGDIYLTKKKSLATIIKKNYTYVFIKDISKCLLENRINQLTNISPPPNGR